MMVRKALALASAALLFTACSEGGAASFDSAALDTDDQKASYGVGVNVGRQLADSRELLDQAAFMRGFRDALEGSDLDVPESDLQPLLQDFGQRVAAAAARERSQVGTENAEAGAAYQEENAARDGVVTTESGLQYEVLREGEGEPPTRDDDVRLHYRGTLIDGTEFDSSYDGDPVVFNAGRLIPGFTEALLLMRPGSHYRIVIPSEIAYGPNGSGPVIGPNSTLVFEIELFEVVE